ncbi:MAG: sigma-70 family RNA polymerase sigma factor [Verrucomicrobia bacterium]|nr:sigma-70 family RNA polymerase sigma factor [Verrucomicrobiota bacterium]
MEDSYLLRSYAENGSEEAFATVVDRYMPLVYSTALRRVDDPEDAKEITQAVFCLLAEKARRFGPGTSLVSWLYQTASFKAARLGRAEWRRRRREEEVARMQRTECDTEQPWEQIAPQLDEALSHLAKSDRLVILLRFFQQKPLKDVGAALGIGEEAARKRVVRALEKLRYWLGKRGVACSAGVLATILTEKAVSAVPAGTAQLVRAAALEAARAACVPSLLATILNTFAREKLRSTLISSLGLVVIAGLSLHLYNASMKSSREPIKPQTEATSPSEGAGRAVKRTWSINSAGPARPEDPALQAALDKLRKLLYAPTIERTYPSRDLTAALNQFGTDTNPALEVLVEALQESDLQRKLRYVPRTRAICSLGYLGIKAEAALPALWELIRSKEAAGRETAVRAALPAIRPVPELAQELIALYQADAVTVGIASARPAGSQSRQSAIHDPVMGHAVEEAIARLMNEHQDIAPEVCGILVSYLKDADGDVRVLAACTLTHPSVQGVVSQQNQAAALEQLVSALNDRDSDRPQALRWRHQNTLRALGNCRATTDSAVQALRQFIAAKPDAELQRLATASLASITSPSVVQIAASTEQKGEYLHQEVNSGSKSVADLANALQDPKTRVQAARALEMLGPKAIEALPALHEGLKSDDELFRELVALTIKKVDPGSPKPLLTSDELTPAIDAVWDQLASTESFAKGSLLQEINQELRKHSFDPAQVAALADKLGAVDPKLRQTFVEKLLEFDPALRTKLIPDR